jgi:hypothetical protein
VVTEPSHGVKRRPASDAQLVGLVEQPLPRQPAMAALALIQVKPQKTAFHYNLLCLGSFNLCHTVHPDHHCLAPSSWHRYDDYQHARQKWIIHSQND